MPADKHPPRVLVPQHSLDHAVWKGGFQMYGYAGGTFGGYTRWAVVFLIIFVLFMLFVPYGGAGTGY